jgi:FkbM family methyltransferase
MSTRLKQLRLKLLKYFGYKRIKSKSILGQKYLIRLGDNFSENSYLNKYENIKEIICCLAWTQKIEFVNIIDIGAHDGFISGQLAQLLKNSKKNLKVYSFEPTLPTLTDLYYNVNKLGLNESIEIIPIAVSDKNSWVVICYEQKNSVLAQINMKSDFSRLTDQSFMNVTMTLDSFLEQNHIVPNLIKIDVEGLETRVLKGSSKAINKYHPAFCIEWNPETAEQTNSNLFDVEEQLKGYIFFYINDYQGQRIPFASTVENLTNITWVCNLFCIFSESDFEVEQWRENLKNIIEKYNLNIQL